MATATTTHRDRLIAQQELVAEEMRQMNAATKRDNRDFTPDEAAKYAALKKQLEAFDGRIEQAESDENLLTTLDNIKSGGAPRASSSKGRSPYSGRDSLARYLAQTPFGKFLAEHRGTLSASGPGWSTPPLLIIGHMGGGDLMAATLDDSMPSGGALVIPDTVDAIVPLPSRPLVVADLMAPGTTDSNLVTVMKEKTVLNAAAVVPSGGLKPESSITFEAGGEPVKKIATWLAVVTELLEDVPGLAAYLNTRLMHFVRLAEDNELLNGDATGDHFNGIVHRAAAPPIARTGTENNADAILRQITAIETATQDTVSGIVMNPANWNAVASLKATDGTYIGSGPFETPGRKMLWGREVAVTPAQVINTAVVGAFRTASQFRRRTPLQVSASNSHASFFIENKVALLAEERGALVVYRDAAFGLVTALTEVVPPV